MQKLRITIYFAYFYIIGGMESAIYYFCKHFCDKYDITVLYTQNKPDDYQIQRLSEIVNCELYTGYEVNTDILLATGWDSQQLVNLFNKTTAMEKVYWNHGIPKNIQTITRYLSYDKIFTVSKNTAHDWNIISKYPPVMYTPVDIPKLKRTKHDKLRLITTSRMSHEKGANRMIKLVDELNAQNVDFEWVIYSDHNDKFYNKKNVILKEPNINVLQDIADSDILVQLSDFETFGLTPYEALQLGTKVVATEFPTFKETKPQEGQYSILKFDCSNLQEVVDFIKNTKPNKTFKYKGIYSNFDRYLYRLQNKKNGIENKSKVYIVYGKLETDITDQDYLIITDTEQDSNLNYIKVENLDTLTYSEILNLVNNSFYYI